MESKDKSLQDMMNLALIPLGLEGWEVLYEPDSSQNVKGRVLAEQKIIIVFTEDPERSKDVFLHEILEVKIQPLITQYQETINGLIKIIEGLNDLNDESQETVNGFIKIVERLTYLDKERIINTLVPLIHHVFDRAGELEQRISEHFYNEAQIMKDILEANLTEEETDELVNFMKRHPYARFFDCLPRLNKKE